jgi:Dihydrofolate reductase.
VKAFFKLFADDVDRLYLTEIDYDFDGDTKMVAIDYDKFKLVEKKKVSWMIKISILTPSRLIKK